MFVSFFSFLLILTLAGCRQTWRQSMSDLQWISIFFRKASQLVVPELLKWDEVETSGPPAAFPPSFHHSFLPSPLSLLSMPTVGVSAAGLLLIDLPSDPPFSWLKRFRSARTLRRRGKSAEIIIRPASKQTGFLEVTAREDVCIWAWTVNSSPCSCWRRKHCSLSTSRCRF